MQIKKSLLNNVSLKTTQLDIFSIKDKKQLSKLQTGLYNRSDYKSITAKLLAHKKMPIHHPYLFNHPKLYRDPAIKLIITVIDNEFQKYIRNISLQKDIFKRIWQRENILRYLQLIHDNKMLELIQAIRSYFFSELMKNKQRQSFIIKESNQHFLKLSKMLHEITIFFRDKSWEFNRLINMEAQQSIQQNQKILDHISHTNIYKNNVLDNLLKQLVSIMSHVVLKDIDNNKIHINANKNHKDLQILYHILSSLERLFKIAPFLAGHNNKSNYFKQSVNVKQPVNVNNYLPKLIQLYFQELMNQKSIKPIIVQHNSHKPYITSMYLKVDKNTICSLNNNTFRNNIKVDTADMSNVMHDKNYEPHLTQSDYSFILQKSLIHSWYTFIALLNLKHFIPDDLFYVDISQTSFREDMKTLDKNLSNYFVSNNFKQYVYNTLRDVERTYNLTKARLNPDNISKNIAKVFLASPSYMIPATFHQNIIHLNQFFLSQPLQLASTITPIASASFKKIA